MHQVVLCRSGMPLREIIYTFHSLFGSLLPPTVTFLPSLTRESCEDLRGGKNKVFVLSKIPLASIKASSKVESKRFLDMRSVLVGDSKYRKLKFTTNLVSKARIFKARFFSMKKFLQILNKG